MLYFLMLLAMKKYDEIMISERDSCHVVIWHSYADFFFIIWLLEKRNLNYLEELHTKISTFYIILKYVYTI